MEKIYCGSGKTRSGQYGEFYSISVCIDDLQEEHVTTAKNGKRYVNLTVNKKKEVDQYGKDLSVTVDTFKPEKAQTTKQEPAHTTKKEYAEDNSETLPF